MGRVLFFPYPGGYGPLSNCVALADKLVEYNQSVAFAYAGHSLPLLAQTGHTILPLKWPLQKVSSLPKFDDKPFKTLYTYDDFACMFMLNDPDWLHLYLAEQLRVIDEWHPDVLVGSWTFTLGLVGRLQHIPVVHIYQAPMYPRSGGFQWWVTDKPGGKQQALKAFNDLLIEYKQPVVQSVEEFISIGDLLLIPAIPEIEPVNAKNAKIHYIGHLVWENASSQLFPQWISDIAHLDTKIVFVYEGGARYGPRLYDAIIHSLGGTATQVVIAIGMETPVGLLPTAPANIHYETFVPAFPVASRSSFVISHGGHGITMLALFCDLPAIVIPTNSEREYYARRIAALQAGIHIPFERVNASVLDNAINQLESNAQYTQQAKKLGEKIRQSGGPQAGADLILQLMHE